jgi:putative tryptophan/tyrosine transport system substrate-binding protein
MPLSAKPTYESSALVGSFYEPSNIAFEMTNSSRRALRSNRRFLLDAFRSPLRAALRFTRVTSKVIHSLAPLLFALVVASWTVSAHGAERIYRIGFLGQTGAEDLKRQIAALREGLRASGYEEGKNLLMEYRWAERKLDRLPSLAAELVGLQPDVIVTHGSAGSRAAKQATDTIPVVIAVIGYPVESRVVQSLSRPGGNVTGLVLQEFETTVKWLELLKQVVPLASRIGWLDVPGVEHPDAAETQAQKEDSAARSLGLAVQRVVVRGPNDLPQVFQHLAQHGVHAVVVPNTSLLNPVGSKIAELAITHRLPTIGSTAFGRAGGLIAYGPDGADMYRRAASYIDAIFKGARAGDLPMEGPPKFELTVNLRTARALGLTIQPTLLEQAHHRID